MKRLEWNDLLRVDVLTKPSEDTLSHEHSRFSLENRFEDNVSSEALSSSGLGHQVLILETGVRFPVGLPIKIHYRTQLLNFVW